MSNVIQFPHEFENRDITNTTRHNRIPFDFIIKLPLPRKSRIINQRDTFGRIIHSFTP